MKGFWLLLKRQFATPFSDKNSVKKNLLGGALTLLLVALILTAIIFTFSKLSSAYLQIKINRIPATSERAHELLTVVYFVIIIALILHGTVHLHRGIFEDGDRTMLLSLPFTGEQLFFSKLMFIYAKQAIISLFVLIATNMTLLSNARIVSAQNVILTLLSALFVPILPLAISSILLIPYHYFKRATKANPILSLAVMVALLAAFCVLYAHLLNGVEKLLLSGKNAFDERVMAGMISFSKYAYPANLFANILLKKQGGKSMGILLAICLVFGASCFFLIRAIFLKSIQKEERAPKQISLKWSGPRRSRFSALLCKEFSLVLRTPSLAYTCFAMALVMPVMAFYSARLGTSLLSNLFGSSNFGFQICTFIVLLYGTLICTFATTSVSRDSQMALFQKTLPFSAAQILGSKLLFGAIISQLALFVTCSAFAVARLESVPNTLLTFLSGSILTAAQILFATRLDLNHPHFGEEHENTLGVSVTILFGLFASLLAGALLLTNSIHPLAGTSSIGVDIAFAICIPTLFLGLALAYFFTNLKNAYARLGEGAAL